MQTLDFSSRPTRSVLHGIIRIAQSAVGQDDAILSSASNDPGPLRQRCETACTALSRSGRRFLSIHPESRSLRPRCETCTHSVGLNAMTGDDSRDRSIDDVAAEHGSVATFLKPLYLCLLREPVRRVVPCLAGARGLTAPLRRYTSNGRLRHPIWLGPAAPRRVDTEPALASGRRARARRGVRVMGVPATGSAGDECDGSVESASCRSPMGRPRERAHGRPVGAGAEGHLAPDGAFGRESRPHGGPGVSSLEPRGSPHVGSRPATKHSILGAFQQACGGSPPRDPRRRRLPTSIFKFSQWSVFISGPAVRVVPVPSARFCPRTDHSCVPWSGNGTSLAHHFFRHAAISYLLPGSHVTAT